MNKTTRTLATLCLAAAVALASLISLVSPKSGTDDGTQATQTAAPAAQQEPAQEEAPAVSEEEAQRETYVSTWAERIDAFNAGYPLGGYGRSFAEAAYDYGVDPRLAAAVARVESGSGSNCTYSCNAWGWGAQGWSDWDTAIREYTAAYAASYGYSISYDIAYVYTGDSASADEWYAQAESCMYQIWGSDGL